MPSPTIEQLLILQDRDTKRLGIEAQLRAVPKEIASVEQRIAAEKAAIDAAKAEVHGLESKKKILETEIGSAETQRGKYQTQQLSVKKNDEYQALGHQITEMGRQIGELEGKELEAMYAIDEAKKRFAAAEATLKQNIAGHESRIRNMKERDASLSEELKGAVAAVAEVRAAVPASAQEAGRRPHPGRQVRRLPPEGFQRGRVRRARQDRRGVRPLRPVRPDRLLGVVRSLPGAPWVGTILPSALGPGRRSKFFDPKARVTPRPIEVWRGKSGHHRAGCCTSLTASAGTAFQGAVTDSVTENIPPGTRKGAW